MLDKRGFEIFSLHSGEVFEVGDKQINVADSYMSYGSHRLSYTKAFVLLTKPV